MSQDLVKQYTIHQIAEQTNILRVHSADANGKPYLKRYIYYQLEKFASDFLMKGVEPCWIIIPGLRGVGKTTILAQVFFAFYGSFKNRVLYVSLDDVTHKLNSNLFEVLDAYEEVTALSFSALKEPVLLLIDEAHYDPKWQFALKSLYDKTKRVFIITTGSSAISLNINTDVARRAFIEKMYPLKFSEYAMLSSSIAGKVKVPALKDGSASSPAFFSKHSIATGEALFHEENGADVYAALKTMQFEVQNYWQQVDIFSITNYLRYYSLPSVLQIEDQARIYQILKTVVDRIVEKDIAELKVFSRDVLHKIEALLFMLAGSDVVSLHSLAKNLGGIEVKTLMSVFEVIEKSQLLTRVYPMGSIYKKIRKPSKYLFLAPSLRAALLSIIDPKSIDLQYKGKLVEDAVGMYLASEFTGKGRHTISYDPAQGGADFVVEKGNKKIVIEVGWNKRNPSQIIKTMKRGGGNYGLLITNSPLDFNESNKIITVPLEHFLLL